MHVIKPNTPAPALSLPVVGGEAWELHNSPADFMNVVVFYRGRFCNICQAFLMDLDFKLGALRKLGAEVVAVSVEPRHKAEEVKKDWNLWSLPVAYDFPISEAEAWGLHVSHARNRWEPEVFVEPGLFLVRPDGSLYASIIATMPFVRPTAAELLASLAFIKDNDYPARGQFPAQPEAG